MSDRNRPKFQCPFGEKRKVSNRSSTGSDAGLQEQIYFSFPGEGDLLITEPSGKQIGYDAQKKSPVNQISEAEISYNDGGLGLNYSPDYVLPYDAGADKLYQILLSGEDLEKETNAELQITAPGFVVGFADIQLDPTEQLTVSISSDGKTLTFTGTADGETPTIYITTQAGDDQPSYSFQIGGVSIEAGKTLTATLDLDNGKVYFQDNDGNDDQYDIEMTRLNPDGTNDEFAQDDLNLGKADNFQMDFGKWDSIGKMNFKVDEDGDGFEDEETVQLENEYKPKPQKP
jgi:hypothetical protein